MTDLVTNGYLNTGDHPIPSTADGVLHLHRFQSANLLAFGHRIARFHRNRHNHTGQRCRKRFAIAGLGRRSSRRVSLEQVPA